MTVDTRLFADADLDGPEAQALYAVLRAHKPWLDPTLAVFERRADRAEEGAKPEMVPVMAAGFAKMKQLTRRAGLEGARLVMGGHSTVPVCRPRRGPVARARAARGERAVPARGDHRRDGNRRGVPLPRRSAGTLRPGFQADLVVLRDNPVRDISAIRTVERVMVAGSMDRCREISVLLSDRLKTADCRLKIDELSIDDCRLTDCRLTD